MPSKCCEAIAPLLIFLWYEVSALELEVNELRKATQKDCKSLKHVVNIAQDISEVETLIDDVRRSNLTYTTAYARTMTDNTASTPSLASNNTANRPGNIPKQTIQYQRHSTNAMTAAITSTSSSNNETSTLRVPTPTSVTVAYTPRASDSKESSSQQSQHASASQDFTAIYDGEWQTTQ